VKFGNAWKRTFAQRQELFGVVCYRDGMMEFESIDHCAFMREALAEAGNAGATGDLPIGAVVVCGGLVVGRGRNRVRSEGDKVRHAEIEALEKARSVRASRYLDCIVYATTEPCVMCLGAIAMADIRHVVFGLRDPSRGGSGMFATIPYVKKQIRRYVGGILADESRELWFKFEGRAP
jgi:tRNA(adenine34) deaminase